MKKVLRLLLLTMSFAIFNAFVYGQGSTINGYVYDLESGEPLEMANISVKGTQQGTISDENGFFSLQVPGEAEVTIQISFVGYKTIELNVIPGTRSLQVNLEREVIMGAEVVISASRVDEKIMEAPLTIQKVSARRIANSPSGDYFSELSSMRDVEIINNSMGFKIFNARGFNTTAPLRVVQFIDGVDNQLPTINIVPGNMFGVNDLDIESIEVISGPASAMYGPNAMQGVLSYKTKSPFKYRGLTVQVKGGNREYFEGQFRVAKTFFDNRFGVKITGSYMKAKDWQSDYIYGRQGANPMIQQKIMGQMLQDPSYADFNNYYKNVEPNAAPFNKVMMPGYSEEDLFNGEIDNMKVSGALYYRFSKDMQAKYVYRYSTGTSLYMGNNRAPLDNFYQQLHMLEFQGKGFTFHAVRSNDDTRNTYTLVGAGVNLGFASLGSVDGAFLPAYVNEIQTLSNNFTTALTPEQINQAINAGSDAAQNSWLEPGTEDFNTAYDKIKENPPPAGAHYQSRTTLYHLDGMYKHSFNKIDFNVGASFRNTNPVSNGSVYADTLVDGKWKKINVSEFGGFAQGIWHAVENKLKVFGSVRLDKSSNYDLQISPRLALVFNLNEYQVIRLTGQSAFRSPAVTDQYQYLNRGRDIVVGNIDGFGNCYTQSSIDSYYKNGKDSTLLVPTVVNAVKPEQLKSIEFGYNGTFFDKLYVEFSTYYSRYSDFIAYQRVGSPRTGTAGEQSGTDAMRNNNYQKYSVATNVEQDVDTYGASIGFGYYFNEKIMVYVNYTYSNIDSTGIGKDVIPGFNTPKHKVNMGIQANKVYKNLGFSVNWKWVDEYYWEAVFASGPVPAYNSLDLQLNYSFPKLYSIFRIGGSNILGTEYIQAYAMPQIGAFYYASWTFNVDFKK